MAYNPQTDSSSPKIYKKFNYHADGSDVGQNRKTKTQDVKNPISITNPLAISDRFGAFDMRETVESVIRDQLKMILLTNKGERICNYDFGADIRRILFESEVIEIEEALSRSIQNNVTKFMPGVRLIDLSLFTSDQIDELQNNEALLRLSYAVDNLQLKSQVELVLRDK